MSLNPGNWNDEVLKADGLTVVYFWHDRCSWCAKLSPVLDEVSTEFVGQIKFTKLNVLESEANKELAGTYGVMGTPTLMFFCQGRSIGQVVSYLPKDQLEQVMQQMLGMHQRCLSQSSDLRSYVS